MSALMASLIGLGANSTFNVGKAALGGIQSLMGNLELKKALKDYPKYNIPEEYMKSLGIYQNLAQEEMPGLKRSEQLIGESTARAMAGAERGAISSNAYMGAVGQAQDKEMQAIQNLAKMNAEWSTQQSQNLAGAFGTMGGLKDTQFQQNVVNPWNIRANMAADRLAAGRANVSGGIEGLTAGIENFIGTDYYNKILQGLQGSKT